MKSTTLLALCMVGTAMLATVAAAQIGGTRPSLVTSKSTWTLGYQSDTTVYATLRDLNNNPIAGQQITFYIQRGSYSANVGRAYTDNSGLAKVIVKPSSYGLVRGSYRLVPQYAGNGAYCASIPSYVLTVN